MNEIHPRRKCPPSCLFAYTEQAGLYTNRQGCPKRTKEQAIIPAKWPSFRWCAWHRLLLPTEQHVFSHSARMIGIVQPLRVVTGKWQALEGVRKKRNSSDKHQR